MDRSRSAIEEAIQAAVPDAEVLLVVPPTAHITWPSLGVHVLQAVAREAGFDARVCYGNMVFARQIGTAGYSALANTPNHWLMGERVFRHAAFGLPHLGDDRQAFLDGLTAPSDPLEEARAYLDQLSDAAGTDWTATAPPGVPTCDRDAVLEASHAASGWADALARAIVERGVRVVGCSTTFHQTAASLALLRRVKALDPSVLTLLGGANCAGAMAEGLLSVAEGVDHVFSGESETTLVETLRRWRVGQPGPRRVLGRPCGDLDALPTPRFEDYFEQLDALHPGFAEEVPVWLYFESSRGCWWGQRHHCTFCGLNGAGMGFREKSAERFLGQVAELRARYPTHRIAMSDNIMPHRYHRTVVPHLADRAPGTHLFYEQKANLSLDQVAAMREAGIAVIQPGIESLATPVLQLMGKGVSARQNVALLRNASVAGMQVKWNLLYAIPGDDLADYERMAEWLPLAVHLVPPVALVHVSIDRFSPYFEHPEQHGLRDLRPWGVYGAVFPGGASLEELAYHFDAEWESGSRGSPQIMARLYGVVTRWQEAWSREPALQPVLVVRRLGPGLYALHDTRGLGGPAFMPLTEAQARAVLVGGPVDRLSQARWALRCGYAVELDGWCTPLATAPLELLRALYEGSVPAVRGAVRASAPPPRARLSRRPSGR